MAVCDPARDGSCEPALELQSASVEEVICVLLCYAGMYINLHELKARLSKILGPDKERQYFAIFTKFLSQKLSKSELDRQVVLTIGKENIALHNQFVKAIFHNAARSEALPAAPAVTDTSKPVKGIRRKPATPSEEPRSNGGDTLPSPRKNRSAGFRKAKSLLGLEASTSEGGIDVLRPVRHPEDGAEQPEADVDSSALKRPRHSPVEELESVQECCTLWPDIRPPLGTPFCVGSVGSCSKQPVPNQHPLTHSLLGDSIEEECLEASDLPDGEGMKRRMERTAVLEHGLQGVKSECGHLLNQAVDVYLKRLIASSVGYVQSRRAREQQHLSKTPRHAALNGVWPAGVCNPPVSALDFKLAMDSDPELICDNRPLHLETIMLRVFEQQQQQRQVLH